jgi:phosphoenolpyruvate-protein phosphotransferase
MSHQLSIKAPLSGVLVPLDTVPDPVFSQKMVGDGIAIDPTSEVLLAPCSGTVVQMHPAGHAVTVRSEEGLEILVHIGIDTVKLKGEGFEPLVEVGQSVEQGDNLIKFSADTLAQKAKSLLSMVIFTNEDMIQKLTLEEGMVETGADQIASVELNDSEDDEVEDSELEIVSETIIVPNPTGLHARPSAVLANLCKRFDAKVQLQKGNSRANARSVVGIMGLEVGRGDKVQLVARGPQAEAALEALVPQLTEGLGEEGAVPVVMRGASTAEPEEPVTLPPRSGDDSLLLGVAASPGIGVGKVFQLREQELEVDSNPAGTPDEERTTLNQAIRASVRELEALVARLHGEADPSKAAIFAAHQELLEDPDLIDLTESSMAKGLSAAAAWKRAYQLHADRLANLKNELLAARANDLRDVGRRVLSKLVETVEAEREIPEGSILIAEDLTPSDTANLDRTKVLGFCTTAGGATSHVAILARSLGLPALAGIETRALDIEEGTRVILFGGRGQLKVDPSDNLIEAVQVTQKKREERRKKQLEKASEPAKTTDGHRVEVAVNVGGVSESEDALKLGAEGVGLLRSEFLFLERSFAPTEDEQFETYSAVAKAMGKDKSVIIRTLDVGGDKPLPYLPLPLEENPFLGQRGIRVLLNRPEIFRPQVRAILRASEFGKMHIMFPMITTVSEFRLAKQVVREEEKKLGLDPIPVGLMIEVPAAAMCAEILAKEADFFSVGTNDLTQYTLAMDRGHPQLAAKIDGLSPAVLRLIKRTVDAAHANDCWVGVCGGIAGEPQAVPILVGLGVDELSVGLPLIPAVKARIREYSFEECQKLAEQALDMEDASDVRALCPDSLEEKLEIS